MTNEIYSVSTGGSCICYTLPSEPYDAASNDADKSQIDLQSKSGRKTVLRLCDTGEQICE
jgi:hypothetical protein